jgi:hypothetical protein
MSLRIYSLLLLAGCAPARQIDLCARDPGVAAAVTGGRFRLTLRDAAGRPLRTADALADAPSSAGLGEGGATVDVEALAASGELVAAGHANVDPRATCVCIRRIAWRGFATWQDPGGAYHDGPVAQFFVGADAGPRIAQAGPVTLDRATVMRGDTLTATVTWTNRASVALDVGGLSVVAAPPGATHAAGVVTDFSSPPVSSIAAGASVTLTSTRTFAAGDAPGTWQLWSRFVDSLGAIHDGPAVELTVGAPPGDPIVPASPVRFDKASIGAGDTLVAHAAYVNTTAQPASLQRIVITARPPGATNVGGPFDDFSPVGGAQTLASGAAIDVVATRDFTAADDSCSHIVCVVSGGQCMFADSGAAMP